MAREERKCLGYISLGCSHRFPGCLRRRYFFSINSVIFLYSLTARFLTIGQVFRIL